MSSYPHNFNPYEKPRESFDLFKPYSFEASDELGPNGQPWHPEEEDTRDDSEERMKKLALQARIDKARAEIKARKKDSQWGAICVATKDLIEGNHKIAARNLIQTYLKAHQR